MHYGIDDIAFSTTHYALPLSELAQIQGIDVGKFHVGLGQEEMSIPAHDEDIVTMGAAAAKRVLKDVDLSEVRTVLFATESGIDQSKAAGVYVHGLLGLPTTSRVVELKQACYSATAAVQLGLAMVQRHPKQKVLVIASDVARYDLGSSGEPTQGAAAVAILLSANPRLLRVEPESGLHTTDVMDFWRPNHRNRALVDGQYSIRVYFDSLTAAWQDYQEQGGAPFADFIGFSYHQPFTRMAVKAHQNLTRAIGHKLDSDQINAQILPTTNYNRRIGNSYTASLYVGLISLLENHPEDLTDKRIGLFSYGSGAVGEFFSATVVPGYQELLRKDENIALLDSRELIDHETYLKLQDYPEPTDGGEHPIASATQGEFRLAAINNDQRIYESR